MSGPRDYQVEGLVIRHADVGERDRIVTLFTREQGKLNLVARGARRPGSTLGPRVQMLTRGRFQCVSRRSLHLMTQAETIESYSSLKNDLWSMACGLYLAELVDASTVEGAPQRGLYELITAALALANTGRAAEVLLRYCEVRSLECLGFCPSLRQCVSCGAELHPVENAMSATLGGALCPACAAACPDGRPLSVDALKVLRFWLVQPMEVASRIRLDAVLSSELEGHLHRFVDGVVQRDLKSREWLARVRREMLLTGNQQAPTIARGTEPP